METDIDMNGHAIVDAGKMTIRPPGGVEATTLAARQQGDAVDVGGNLTVEGSVQAQHLRAKSGEVAGTINVSGGVTTAGGSDSRLDVTQTLGQNHAVQRMSLSGPGPQQGMRSLLVGKCHPPDKCGVIPVGAGVGGGNAR